MVCWHAVLPAVLNSRIDRGCPRLFELWTAVTVRLLRSLSLDSLDTSVSRSSLLHAFHLELSAPPDDKSLFQYSATWLKSRSSVKQQSRLRYHVVSA